MRKLFLVLTLAVFCIPTTLLALTRVQPLLDLEDADVANFLTEQNWKLMDLSASPLLRAELDEIAALVAQFATQENLGLIKVGIVDDVTPNALFWRFSKDKSMILVNIGLFLTVENKDELAYILGHEISHGLSDLQKHIDEKYAPTGERIKDFVNSIKKDFFRRPVESEVDIRSLRYLQANKLNPHAGSRWLRRFYFKYANGSGVDESHTSLQSRLDVLESALTYWQRVKGEVIVTDEAAAYTPGVAAVLRKEFIDSGQFKALQLPKAEQALEWAKQQILNAHPNRLTVFWHPYDMVDYFWPVIMKPVQGLLNAQEQRQLKIKAFVEIVNAFEIAHEKAVREKVTNPAHAAQSGMSRNMPDTLIRQVDHGRKPPALWLSQFFSVATFEDLPPQVRQVRVERQARFEEKQIEFKRELLRMAERPGRDFEEIFKWLTDIVSGYSKNSKELIVLERLFTPSELSSLFIAWQASLDIKPAESYRSPGIELPGNRLLLMELWLKVDPVRAKPYVTKSFLKFFNGIPELPVDVNNDPEMGHYFLLMDDIYPEPVLAAAFSDREVRAAALRQFAPLASRFYAKGGLKEMMLPFERLAAAVNKFRLNSEREILAEVLRQLVLQMANDLKTEFHLSDAQAEVLVLLKLPALGGLMKQAGLLTPSAEDIAGLMKTLPVEAFEKVGAFTFNALVVLLKGFSVQRLHDEIYFMQTRFAGKAIELLTRMGYDVAAWHPRRMIKVNLGLPGHDYQWILTRKLLAYEKAIADKSPRDYKSRLEALSYLSRDYPERVEQILFAGLEDLNLKYAKLPPPERIWRIFHESKSVFGLDWAVTDSIDLFSEFMNKHLEFDYRAVWGLIQVYNDRFVPDPRQIELPPDRKFAFYRALKYLAESDLALISIESLGLFLEKTFLMKPGGREVDLLFDAFWSRTEHQPELRKRILKLEFIEELMFDNNKVRLALEILDDRFHIRATSVTLRRGGAELPEPFQVRPQFAEIKTWLVEHFPDTCAVRDALLEEVMNRLLTTAKETELLQSLLAHGEGWYRSSKLSQLDLPDMIGRQMKTNEDRLELIEYLIGISNQFEERLNTGGGRLGALLPYLRNERRQFRESAGPMRAYILQGLMGSVEEGVLSEVKTRDRVYQILLGERARQNEVVAVFKAYLEGQDLGARKVVISNLLQSLVESSENQKHLSVSVVFNSGGAFGAKSAQAFRTTGLGGAELQRELDTFFDRAQPPSRATIYADLKSIFGENLTAIHSVGALVGSGSLNYVVVCELRDLDGSIHQVAVRIQKSGVVGQVTNEDKNWQKAIQKLANSSDPAVSNLAKMLEEIRLNVMATLKDGGVEFDLSHERASYPDAAKVYSRAGGYQDWEVQAVAPKVQLQKLVNPNWQSRASVYEYIDGVPLTDVSDDGLRRHLAAQIVRIEFAAFFAHGLFDRDGHPGNWLIDLKRRRMVRLDYAQISKVDDHFRETFKVSLGILLKAQASQIELQRLAQMLPDLFDLKAGAKAIEGALQAIVSSADFPAASEPHLRYLALRNGLESHLGQAVRFRSQTGAALGMLARVSLFKKEMGESQFNLALFDQLGMREKVALAYETVVKKMTSFFMQNESAVTHACSDLLTKK